jgi:ABC-type amino acid transport substrate-binding protein
LQTNWFLIAVFHKLLQEYLLVYYTNPVNNWRCIFFPFQEDLAWAFPKKSPYFEVINHQLKLLSESGLMNKIVEKQVKIEKSKFHFFFVFTS